MKLNFLRQSVVKNTTYKQVVDQGTHWSNRPKSVSAMPAQVVIKPNDVNLAQKTARLHLDYP